MTTTTHTPTPDAFYQFYKGWLGKTPANAVRLAVADIHKVNGGTLDYIHELNRAATMCDEHDALTARVAELEAALNASEMELRRALSWIAESNERPGHPNYLTKARVAEIARAALKGAK